MPQYMEFAAFLRWCQGPGINLAVGALLAVVVEYWPQFQAMQSKHKRLAFFGLCLAVPLLAAVVACASGYQVWSFAATFWPVIWAGIVAAGSGTLVHTKYIQEVR